MSPRYLTLVPLLLVLGGPRAVRADKMDKDSKKWLDDVSSIMLPDERKTFEKLGDKSERDEFQKIFWARRNPSGPEAPENQFRKDFEKARAEADQRFRARVGSTPGSSTDCGRVFILLGPPDNVQKMEGGDYPDRRSPESWTYRGPRFKDGQAVISFEEDCRLPQGARLGDQLNRLAESKIVSPNIGYVSGKDGRLVKLVDQLPKPTLAQALLKEPRQDFALAAEPALMLRSADGATYVAGLIRAEGAGLTSQDAGGKKTAKIVVAGEALDSEGRPYSVPERETTVELGDDGTFLASFGLAVKPGRYTLRVGAVDPKSKKGSAASIPLEAPDFNASGDLTLAKPILIRDIQEGAATDPREPFADFSLGKVRVMPRFKNVFFSSDSLTILCAIYNARTDEATHKPSVTAQLTILRAGKPVAQSEEKAYEIPDPSHLVGPVPLDKYGAGKYTVQVKVRDNVAKKDYAEEAPFEIQ